MLTDPGMPLEQIPSRGNCLTANCAARQVLGHVTGRWGGLVMTALEREDHLRFSQLRNRIGGISEKMLSQTLRDLVRDGLVRRTSRPVVPPYVEYALTNAGREVATRFASLVSWLEHHVRDFIGAQRAHDATSGDDVWERSTEAPATLNG